MAHIVPAAITAALSGVQPGQTVGLLLFITVLPCALMLIAHLLYKKHYKLDEAEYERICQEIQRRKAGAAV